MRDTLSTNGEHLRVAEVKSFQAIPKSMRSVNGDRNGANLKKWSVLLVCTIELDGLVNVMSVSCGSNCTGVLYFVKLQDVSM